LSRVRAISIVIVVGCSSSSPPVPDRPPVGDPVAPSMTRPRIVAHRGASHDAPENTIAAFKRAWDAGVECVELDVHLTSDGVPVIIHDADTKRTTGKVGKVASQTLAEIRALDAGTWKHPSFAGERIPTLAEALATIPRGRTMFVEIKTGPDTVPPVAKVIREQTPAGANIALQAFDPASLALLAKELPNAPAYWTVDPPVDDSDKQHPKPLPYPKTIVAEAVRHGFAGVALYYGSVDDALLADLRAAKLLVDVWTINEPEVIARWHARDVRWIETDRPDITPK
jgi:glycerophosphoryl diester phosphodiesterase